MQKTKKLLSLFLVICMVMTMFAGSGAVAFAGSADPVAVEIYGHTAFFADIDVYESDAAGTVSEKTPEKDMLNSIIPDSGTYTVNLVPGYYVIEGKKEVGSGEDKALKSIGTILVNVTNETREINLCAITGIKASNSGWVRGEDYEVAVTVADKDKNERVITLSEEIDGNLSCLALEGDTVTAVYTPTAKHPDYIEERYSRTYNANTSGHSSSMKQVVEVSVSAPENSTIDMGKGPGADYYIYTFYDAASTGTSGSNEVSTFRVPVNTDVFYRVQNPNGVTYWNWGKYSTTTAIEVSAADLHIGDAAFTKNTLNRSFSNVYDLANIYINGNEAGYINLNNGGSYELNCFRNWMAIENIMNQKVALPDMHYQVIDFNGNASDVITVTPHAKNSCVADIEANKAGTAIVLVTYDAMTHAGAMGSTGATGNPEYRNFSAIWPEFTGVLVVSVGEDGTSVAKNMTMDRPGGSPTVLDAEHDIFFYCGDEGANYTFKPEAGATVSIARPVVSSKDMTYGGFSTDGITTDSEGKVTLTGLKNGRNIIKIEKGGIANYQVITAREVSYTMKDANGNLITDANKPKAGDKVCLQFTGLVNPAEKLSGVYNFNASLFYTGEDESTFKSNPGGGFGMYDFNGKPERQYIEITIPKYWAADTYSLTGVIKMGGFGGPLTAHRGITYATGKNPNFSAPGVSMVMSSLPDLNIALGASEFINCKLKFVDNNGDAVNPSALDVSLKDADGNALQVANDGTFKGVAETFSYEIAGSGYARKVGSIEITADGSHEYEIVLTKLTEGAWDGKTKTEPTKNGDVYQVTNGAEMAWVVAESENKKDIKAELVNDIELGGYVWVAKASSSNYTFQFDGKGHTVSGLNGTRGLFGAIGKDSYVRNLTVKGEITDGGSIVGYINGKNSSVENCISYVNVKSAKQTVGGLVGYATDETVVKKCINYGNVEGKNGVGGIIGGFVGNCVVEECINHGNVKATESNAGGIFGGSGYPVTIKNSYNDGNVESAGNAGGIGGELKGGRNGVATVENCYSSGRVTGNGAFGSVAGKGVVSNCAYLADTAAADENAEGLNSAELASFNFGDAFVLACHRYPALAWEEGITRHESSGRDRVVAPGCLTKGYTEHTCKLCRETYKDTYVEPLGHEKGTDAVDDGMKCTYTCARCHQKIVEWHDARFQYLELGAPYVSGISFVDGDHKWDWNSAKNRFESKNAGEDNTTATTTLKFKVEKGGFLSFDYGVSSEANYDKANITLKKGDVQVAKVADAISGSKAGSYVNYLEPGEYSLEMSFNKDSGSASGEDLAFLSGLKFEGLGAVTVNFVVTGAENDTVKLDIQAADGLAEEYGYDVAQKDHKEKVVEKATVFDLLVAVHKAVYGDAFTKETAKNYLDISNGMLTKAFGKPASTSGFAVNHTFPMDEAGTGYVADTTRLADGDTVDFWFYRSDLWADYFCFFTEGKLSAKKGATVSVGMKGFTAINAMSPAGCTPEAIDWDDANFTYSLVNMANGQSTAVDVTVSADGKVEFTAPSAGTYILRATGSYDDEPIISPWCLLTATNPRHSSGNSEKAGTTVIDKPTLPTGDQPAQQPVATKTETKTDPEGNKATVTTDATGKKASEVQISAEAVKKAEEGGAPVALPVPQVKPQTDAAKADSVKVQLPAGTAKMPVSIPVTGADDSTVLMKINEDGSMIPVLTATVSEDGASLVGVVGNGNYAVVENKVEFKDVVKGAWYEKGASFVSSHNLMVGMGDGSFAQASSLTVAQTAAVIGRIEGQSTSDSWEKAAAKYGTVEVNTRQNTIGMLMNAYKEMGGIVNVSAEKVSDKFADANAITTENAEAMEWAVQSGLLAGVGNNSLAPNGQLSRGQFATMLERFAKLLCKITK